MSAAIAAAAPLERVAWVLSNHDFPRLATRLGEHATRAAAMLLLTLPGTAFVYQGDEIGMVNGPGGDPPIDLAGRDPQRHPMQWRAEPGGGFSSGEPWLPLIDPGRRSVEAQREDPASLLHLYRRLIGLRRELRGEIEILDAPPGMLAYSRGAHVIAINLTDEPLAAPVRGEVVLATGLEAGTPGRVGAGAGLIVRRGDV